MQLTSQHRPSLSDAAPQGVWKAVSAWSRRTLERAGERVMDVHGDEEDELDEDEAVRSFGGNASTEAPAP